MRSRQEILELISSCMDDRPVHWASSPLPYEGRDRTIMIFYAEVPDRLELRQRLRPFRDELQEAAGGPLILMFMTREQTEKRHLPEVAAWRQRHDAKS